MATVLSTQAAAQAPATPDKPWAIPQIADRGIRHPVDVRGLESGKRYGLVDLINLLVESCFLPQI